jgi:hypothetical protein
LHFRGEAAFAAVRRGGGRTQTGIARPFSAVSPIVNSAAAALLETACAGPAPAAAARPHSKAINSAMRMRLIQ